MTRTGKQPRVGDFIAGKTGQEEVVMVFDRGLSLTTRDALGRLSAAYRHPDGHWRITKAGEAHEP